MIKQLFLIIIVGLIANLASAKNDSIITSQPIPASETYNNNYVRLDADDKMSTDLAKRIQPWNNYCPVCNLKDKSKCEKLPCQTHNIKLGETYDKIQIQGNKWALLASQVAKEAIKHGGGPFGAVAVQIDDKTHKVIRYWLGYNHVVKWHDPSAHAEIVAIREAAKALGVFDLGHIKKEDSKLPQGGAFSHVVLYSSAEPCPMCMSAIYWARIPTLVFSATRYDAAQQGVGFSDEMIYEELKKSYSERKNIKVYQATTNNSLDAFNLWKRSSHTDY